MGVVADIKDQRFGSLVAKRRLDKNSRGSYLWRCECDCGNFTKVIVSNLRSGNTVTCGCSKKVSCYSPNHYIPTHYKHGYAKKGKSSSTYKSWGGMRERCYNENHHKYKNYGGRGIIVCDRWKDSFENFLEDMGECPKELSIDRVNNNGNYEPSNCRWATQKQQQNNRRDNIFYTFEDKTLTMGDWSILTGIKEATLRRRREFYNWSMEETLTTSVKIGGPQNKTRVSKNKSNQTTLF